MIQIVLLQIVLMTHNGILAKQIIRIRLTKSYEEHDFLTYPKKRDALLTPEAQVFGNSYNWVRK